MLHRHVLCVSLLGLLLGLSLGAPLSGCSSDSPPDTTSGTSASSASSSGIGGDGGASSSSSSTSSGSTTSSTGGASSSGAIWGCAEAGGSCICQNNTDKQHESVCTGTYKCCVTVPFAGAVRCQCSDPGATKCEDDASKNVKVVPRCPPP